MSERPRAGKLLLAASLALNVLLAGAVARGRIRALLDEFRSPQPGAASANASTAWDGLSAGEKFSHFPRQAESTIFLGDSITAEAPLDEMFANVGNRGVPGNTTTDVLARLEEVSARKPRQLFVLIGINDLLRGTAPDAVFKNIETLLGRAREETAGTDVVLISILPIRTDYSLRTGYSSSLDNRTIAELNQRLSALAHERSVRFIDAFSALRGPDGQLRAELTSDGIHLRPEGYWALRSLLLPARSPRAPEPRDPGH